MYKKLFGLSVMFMAIGLWAFADNMETITLTTYYPAPYGVYFQLATKRLSVGLLTQADQPNRDGDMRLQPQPGDPTNTIDWPVGQAGQLAYSQTKDAFYHSNGSQWVADSGGSSGTVMYLDCPAAVQWYYDPISMSDVYGPYCIAPACPTGWTSQIVFTKTAAASAASGVYSTIQSTVYYDNVRVCTKN